MTEVDPTSDQATNRNTAPVSLASLLSRHHGALFGFIYSLTGNAEDTNDIFQETAFALFEKFDQFDAALPFLPWARRFAYLQVLKFREREVRRNQLFDSDVVELIARQREQEESKMEQRASVLIHCVDKLPEKDRDLVRQRYLQQVPADQICDHSGLNRRTLFRHLKRIRHQLLVCIEKSLAEELGGSAHKIGQVES